MHRHSPSRSRSSHSSNRLHQVTRREKPHWTTHPVPASNHRNMRKAILASSFVASSLLLITVIRYTRLENTPVSHVDVFDGFETSELSKIWDTSRFARGAVTMQSEIVRGGRGAA